MRLPGPQAATSRPMLCAVSACRFVTGGDYKVDGSLLATLGVTLPE
jgi:hypothetical protein